jgi:hypothetical protein
LEWVKSLGHDIQDLKSIMWPNRVEGEMYQQISDFDTEEWKMYQQLKQCQRD